MSLSSSLTSNSANDDRSSDVCERRCCMYEQHGVGLGPWPRHIHVGKNCKNTVRKPAKLYFQEKKFGDILPIWNDSS